MARESDDKIIDLASSLAGPSQQQQQNGTKQCKASKANTSIHTHHPMIPCSRPVMIVSNKSKNKKQQMTKLSIMHLRVLGLLQHMVCRPPSSLVDDCAGPASAADPFATSKSQDSVNDRSVLRLGRHHPVDDIVEGLRVGGVEHECGWLE